MKTKTHSKHKKSKKSHKKKAKHHGDELVEDGDDIAKTEAKVISHTVATKLDQMEANVLKY